MLRANRWLYDPRNKREAAEILTKYTKLSAKMRNSLMMPYLAKYKATAPMPTNQTGDFNKWKRS